MGNFSLLSLVCRQAQGPMEIFTKELVFLVTHGPDGILETNMK